MVSNDIIKCTPMQFENMKNMNTKKICELFDMQKRQRFDIL